MLVEAVPRVKAARWRYDLGRRAYDDFAASYEAENVASLLNAFYARPAMVDLAGDVDGRRILDAGCGAGPLTALLRDRGARMTGLDGSPAMVDLARKRLGDDVPLHVHDLAQPLPFADDSFDDVVSSLVLHYLEDWDAPLAETDQASRMAVLSPTERRVWRPSTARTTAARRGRGR